MKIEKYSLPNPLPIDREGIAKVIQEVNEYAGKL